MGSWAARSPYDVDWELRAMPVHQSPVGRIDTTLEVRIYEIRVIKHIILSAIGHAGQYIFTQGSVRGVRSRVAGAICACACGRASNSQQRGRAAMKKTAPAQWQCVRGPSRSRWGCRRDGPGVSALRLLRFSRLGTARAFHCTDSDCLVADCITEDSWQFMRLADRRNESVVKTPVVNDASITVQNHEPAVALSKLPFMKLKKYAMDNGIEREQLQNCMDRTDILRALGYRDVDKEKEPVPSAAHFASMLSSPDAAGLYCQGLVHGTAADAKRPGTYSTFGVGAVLSICGERAKPPSEMPVLHLETLLDTFSADLIGHLPETLRFIHRNRAEGRVVLVHCSRFHPPSLSFIHKRLCPCAFEFTLRTIHQQSLHTL